MSLDVIRISNVKAPNPYQNYKIISSRTSFFFFMIQNLENTSFLFIFTKPVSAADWRI
jgi:hypothetical protein